MIYVTRITTNISESPELENKSWNSLDEANVALRLATDNIPVGEVRKTYFDLVWSNGHTWSASLCASENHNFSDRIIQEINFYRGEKPQWYDDFGWDWEQHSAEWVDMPTTHHMT